MAQIPNNISPAGAQAAARPSGITDANLLSFLSLLKIDGKPLTMAESRKNPREIAEQIKQGLATHGFSEADLPKLAVSILRDRKAGKVSNSLDLPSAYFKKAKEEISFASMSPEMRVKVMHGKIQPKALNITSETLAAKMTEVKLHPEPPKIEQYKAPVDQYASVLKVYDFFNKAGVFNA